MTSQAGNRGVFGGLSAAQIAAVVAAWLFLVAVVRLGWVSDDAFIAIRSVDHLVAGKGFVLNVGERVQSFTSPLWALLCVPFFAIARNPYAALVVPGLACSLGMVAVVWQGWRKAPWQAAVTLLLLSASLSFLHFSTSGLENSLAHLLAALFVFERLRAGNGVTRVSFLIAAGLFLTRFDYALLVAPSLAVAVRQQPREAVRLAWPAVAVVAAWLVFATVYYGFPLPNTAYAKLNTSIPLGQRIAQGFAYLVDSSSRDPIVLVIIGAAGVLSASPGQPSRVRWLAAGVGTYLAYVLYVGGDFMSGRFLTVAYLVSVLLGVHVAAAVHQWLMPVAAAAATLLALPSFEDRRVDPRGLQCFVPESGIVDERECYVEHTGLPQNIRRQKWKSHGYLRDFEKVAKKTKDDFVVFDLVGLVSYANRGEKHIVERYALTEPLLARIRFRAERGWRIGHFFRPLPAGYEETLRTGKNQIVDRCLNELYDRLSLVTRGPLWSAERLAAIAALNTTHRTCDAP